MGPVIDLDRVRAALPQATPKLQRRAKAPRHQHGEKFLRGPVPLAWLEAAAHLPGKALHVGVDLWYQVGLLRGAAEFPYSVTGAARRFGMDRANASRALTALEAAGLVEVHRAPGKRAVVRILRVPESTDDQPEDGGKHD